MEQYSFDSLGQMVPCPDREKCGAYKCPPLPDGTPRGCTGERKWCKMKFKESEENNELRKRMQARQNILLHGVPELRYMPREAQEQKIEL